MRFSALVNSAASKYKTVGALANELNALIAQLGELRLAQRHPVFKLTGIVMAQQIDRLLFRYIKLLKRCLGHKSPC